MYNMCICIYIYIYILNVYMYTVYINTVNHNTSLTPLTTPKTKRDHDSR